MKVRTIKPFDVEKAKQGVEIQTKIGYKVRISAYDIEDKDFPILAVVTVKSDEGIDWRPLLYNGDGISKEEGVDYNLQIIEEEEIKSEDEKMLDNIQGCLNFFFDKCDYDEKCISKENILKWIENKKKDTLREGHFKPFDESWWAARDKNGVLYAYSSKPIRVKNEDRFKPIRLYDYCSQLDSELFPELTWQNSPKRIEMKLLLKLD
jgi:hypothetical protein